jgi:hypothetical protein
VNAAALEQTSGARLTVQVSTDQRSPFELDIAGDSLNPQETRLPVAPNRDAAEGGAGNAAVAGSLAIATPVLAPISAEPIRDPDPTAAELPQTFAMTQVVLSLESCTPKKDCTLDFHTVASGWTTERLSLSVSVTLDHTSYTSCSGWEAADEYSQEAKVELKNDD